MTAESRFAEVLCRVEFCEPLTRARAHQLHDLHPHHPPDDCLVRLASLIRLAEGDTDELLFDMDTATATTDFAEPAQQDTEIRCTRIESHRMSRTATRKPLKEIPRREC
ncbi:hypothetical protein [Nocardia arthritidis]|uniref:Uncharacterized protein n=1 Tax=Nocardia arthritidis TaxID=228602 RepID=A0A6G9Y9J9_9NOCA|nr:hypothetical protein [Nocardia arthritidis]QIS09824.1 hypothetical protein F5544_09620 [Nocardia arthritidis]